MKKTIKYVVMNFYTPSSKHYSEYRINIYSKKSSNKDTIVEYCHKVRQQDSYKNNNHYKWYVLTEDQALAESIKLHKWQREEERKDLERRFPVRYVGQTAKEELANMMAQR